MSEEKIMTAVITNAVTMNCICRELSQKIISGDISAETYKKSLCDVKDKN